MEDGSGKLLVVFLGRREVPGIGVGTCLTVEGRVLVHHDRWIVLNPLYTLRNDG
ncbi:MAG: hypothetical protein ACYC1D_04445 [Acidimicrobiales bacterium]